MKALMRLAPALMLAAAAWAGCANEPSGLVLVPEVIAPNQTTTVHLDSEGVWQPDTKHTGTNLVRLADGQVVGCLAVPVRAYGRPETGLHH